jgi:hypothetical protein
MCTLRETVYYASIGKPRSMKSTNKRKTKISLKASRSGLHNGRVLQRDNRSNLETALCIAERLSGIEREMCEEQEQGGENQLAADICTHICNLCVTQRSVPG